MKALTINDLSLLCKEEIKKGNGNKTIMISSDDEGNNFHYLWYSFSSIENVYDEDNIDENVAKKEDTIILG